LTKTVPETRAERGDDEHLGYDTHEQTWSKTMLIEATGQFVRDHDLRCVGPFYSAYPQRTVLDIVDTPTQ
jgi:hypothetical protein